MKNTRDFYTELKNATFKSLTYKLYNKLDDEGFLLCLKNKTKENYSIDDFEYLEIELDKKESFLITMHNKELLSKIKDLKEKIEAINGTVDIDYNNGTVSVIKLITKKIS